MNNSDIELDLQDFIREFCSEIGPRVPCSKAESDAAELFRSKLENQCDEVAVEVFKTSPSAYKAGFRLPAILYVLVVLFYWSLPLLSLIFALLAFSVIFGEMSLAKQVVDFAFPKKSSINIIGKIVPKSVKKGLIIVGSHLDSNWEFPLFRKWGYGSTIIIALNVIFSFLAVIFLFIVNALVLFELSLQWNIISVILFLILVLAIPSFLLQLFFMISNRPVMGANDNLSAMAICYELAKAFGAPDNKTNSLEIWFVAFGSEEIGSKGSRAFVQSHLKEISSANVINIDMPGNKNDTLVIGTAEVFGLAKMDKDLVEMIKKTADELGIKAKKNLIMAFTDSLSFSRKGVSATSIISLPKSPKEFYYHTRNDVIENLNFENLVKTFKICVELIKRMDNTL